MKPSGVLNFENVPADAGDPDVKVYVNGEEVSTGGGGDSDYTKAIVSIGEGVECDIYSCVGDVSDSWGLAPETLPTVLSYRTITAAGEYETVLYKGHSMVTTNLDYSELEITGSATRIIPDFEYVILDITGDCSITYTGE